MSIRRVLWPAVAVLFAIPLISCSALNPFCNDGRPNPSISTIAPATVTLPEVQATLVLTVTGSKFVASSLIYWNGAPLATTVVSPTELRATITTAQIPGAGTSQVSVHTPSNYSGDIGCDSGGDSATLTFTVT